ncbi:MULTISPECIES: L-histidine N(alpha)-methyltransferase [Bradyrhizobium]|uniref:L-histidine N(alpha)-methyltransferase n=2 Tax=Bradyrhizobium brasilense TaxID=1419277 RepID=UPI0035306C15
MARAEMSILRERQSDIADFVQPGAIEYGAGAGIKTEFVLAGPRDPRGYVPIDIADAFLEETSKRIASRFPLLWVRPIERNFPRSRVSRGLPAPADGRLPKIGRMRTGYSACSA